MKELNFSDIQSNEKVNKYLEEKRKSEENLKININNNKEKLTQLLNKVNDHWGYEDGIYRFYHQSFKVYKLQKYTIEMVSLFKELADQEELDPLFLQIIEEGTGKEFTHAVNNNWLNETRYIVEAFLHSKYFLENIIQYGIDNPQEKQMVKSGWASILTLFRRW
jgi:hypothetical protein